MTWEPAVLIGLACWLGSLLGIVIGLFAVVWWTNRGGGLKRPLSRKERRSAEKGTRKNRRV